MASNPFEERASTLKNVPVAEYNVLRQKRNRLVGPPNPPHEPIIRLQENVFYLGVFEVENDSRFFAVSIPIMFARLAFLSSLNEADARVLFLTPDLKRHFARDASIDSNGDVRLDQAQTIKATTGWYRMGFVIDRPLDPLMVDLERELHDAQYDALSTDDSLVNPEGDKE